MATHTSEHRLVLWDVDHTLIETRGVGKRLYIAAFEAVTGQDLVHAIEPTGRTELAILRETLERHGIQASQALQARYAAELAAQYERSAAELRQQGRALPGARETLAALAGIPGLVQTVLTGNLRTVAMVKLRVFNLDGFIDFDVGAYGEDDIDRAKLVSIAQARATARHNITFDYDNTVIIGDTPHDIAAAHQGGARIVAVASGRSTVEQLRHAGADTTLPDLIDTQKVTDEIITATRPAGN